MNWLTMQMEIVASHNTRWQRKDDMAARVVGGRATRESKSHGLVGFGTRSVVYAVGSEMSQYTFSNESSFYLINMKLVVIERYSIGGKIHAPHLYRRMPTYLTDRSTAHHQPPQQTTNPQPPAGHKEMILCSSRRSTQHHTQTMGSDTFALNSCSIQRELTSPKRDDFLLQKSPLHNPPTAATSAPIIIRHKTLALFPQE
jgi:hypothetical protein